MTLNFHNTADTSKTRLARDNIIKIYISFFVCLLIYMT